MLFGFGSMIAMTKRKDSQMFAEVAFYMFIDSKRTVNIYTFKIWSVLVGSCIH